ncbi:gluconeogenesis factor YvcK family protein [Desulfurispora thermophila]|uniref:gluconeogenesis factor YvcK family protein n=1 Tax=Desulfurispora thermophila TaxID=265470 RepID=UPI00036C9AC3|nr:YvcK family protein [Desulfurispora thermophila]
MRQLVKWLYPGLQVKRWLLLAAGGFLLTLAASALLAARFWPFPRQLVLEWGRAHLGLAADWPWLVLVGLTGLAANIYGLYRAVKSLLVVLQPDGTRLVDLLYARHYLRRGPRIVVVGGGTGLSTLLRGLKKYTSNITAIVSVADDGGSSGRLRQDMGILPPGDIRNCLVALADRESLMEQLFRYRFPSGELAGHSLGNLLLAGMADLTGSFQQAVHDISRVLAVRGRVLPVTLQKCTLGARYADGGVVWGESSIPQPGRQIAEVFLSPADCRPLPEALAAIEQADLIVIGPGSLYTSILPNLLVPGVSQALQQAAGRKVYVCNVMTQPGETEGYTASRHLQVLQQYAGRTVDWIVVNRAEVPVAVRERYAAQQAGPVVVDETECARLGVTVLAEDLLQIEGQVVRHHPEKLAGLLMGLLLADRPMR